MICPKCKSKINNDLKCCPRCGELFKANDIDLFTEIYNLKLLEVYYPNKGEKIKVNGISLLYMFFTYFHAIANRMYKCAASSIIAILIFNKIFPNFWGYALSFFGSRFYIYVFLIVGCLATYIYYIIMFDRLLLKRRKETINYIIKNNPDKSFEEIKELVILDNKKNYIGVIIAVIITLIYIIYVNI